MAGLLIDTCILVDSLRGKTEARDFLRSPPERPIISVLTAAELYKGCRRSEETASVSVLLARHVTIGVSLAAAREGGLFHARYHPSHGLDLVDAMLAATALEEGLTFATLNRKHFPMLSDVIAPYKAA